MVPKSISNQRKTKQIGFHQIKTNLDSIIIKKLPYFKECDQDNEKTSPQNEEKMFADHMSDKQLVSRMYLELLQLSKKTNRL